MGGDAEEVGCVWEEVCKWVEGGVICCGGEVEELGGGPGFGAFWGVFYCYWVFGRQAKKDICSRICYGSYLCPLQVIHRVQSGLNCIVNVKTECYCVPYEYEG